MKKTKKGMLKKEKKESYFSNTTITYHNAQRIGLIFFLIVGITLIAYNTITFNGLMQPTAIDIVRSAEAKTTNDELTGKQWNAFTARPLQFITQLIPIEITLVIISTIIISIIAYIIWQFNQPLLFLVIPISPFFIQISTEITSLTVALVMSLITLFTLFKKQPLIAIIPYTITALYNPFMTLILFIYITYEIYYEKISKKFLPAFLIIASLSVMYMPTTASIITFNPTHFIEFGEVTALSIIVLIIGLCGFILFYKKEKKATLLTISGIIITLLNIETGLILLTIMSIYYTTKLIEKLIQEKWESPELQFLSVCLIACSILISSITYVTAFTPMNDEQKECYAWLNNNITNQTTIFAHWNDGSRIAFYTNNKVITDNYLQEPFNTEKTTNIETTIASRNKEMTQNILTFYETTHIFLTRENSPTNIWEKRNGILFLLDTTDLAEKEFANTECEIWKINSQE